MHIQEIVKKKKKKIGMRTQSRRSAKIIIKKNSVLEKKIYFVLEIFVKKIRRPTKTCNNCRKLFGGGSENLKIKLVWPYIALKVNKFILELL